MSPTGAAIMSFFAMVWWIMGARASGHGSLLMTLVPVFITGAIVAIAVRRNREPDRRSPAEHSRQGRLVGWASAGEGVAIFVTANVLANVGQKAWTVPSIAIIVGLHFFPLARWLPARLYYITGALLVAIGAVGGLVPELRDRPLTVSVPAAAVLWLTSILVLRASSPARE